MFIDIKRRIDPFTNIIFMKQQHLFLSILLCVHVHQIQNNNFFIILLILLTLHKFHMPISVKQHHQGKHYGSFFQYEFLAFSFFLNSSAFSNTTSELLTEMKSRLNNRPSESSPKLDRLYEIPVKVT